MPASDGTLVLGVRNGDRSAFAELYDRRARLIRAICYDHSRDLPRRIAFRVASRLDSRIVLDQNGAETLLGRGDMLFLPPGTHKPTRVQGTYVSSDELRRVVDHLAEHAEP